MAADGIGSALVSVAGRSGAVIVLEVAGSIADRPSRIAPAWESDQHTLMLIARPTLMDHLMIGT